MGLTIDTGKKAKEAEGIPPARLKQYFQLAGRNPFRLGANGPGAAAKEWKDGAFEVANPDLYGDGGHVILQVRNNGQDFDVVGVGIVPRASTGELDKKVTEFCDKALIAYTKQGADEAPAAAPAPA